MTSTIPPRQAEVLAFVIRSIEQRGKAPTYGEIGEAMGVKSPATIHKHLKALQRRGLVTIRRRQSGSLGVCDGAVSKLQGAGGCVSLGGGGRKPGPCSSLTERRAT